MVVPRAVAAMASNCPAHCAHPTRSWRRRTPEEFVFVMKLNRWITHRKKLAEHDRPERETSAEADQERS